MSNLPDSSSWPKEEKIGKKEYRSNLAKSLICLALGALVFFVPLEFHGGQTNILFGAIVDFLVVALADVWFWLVIVIIVSNSVAYFYGKSKNNKQTNNWAVKLYGSESSFQGLIYILGALYAILFAFQIGPSMVVDDTTGGVIINDIVLPVGLIVALGGMFVMLFLAFGGLQLVGTLLEPVMRPVFKIPGKAALDTVSSFFGASSVGAYVTSKLYKENIYTKKEAATIATSFCVVSIGFAALVTSTVGLLSMFTTIFVVSFITILIIAAIIVRIPPLSKKPDVYFNGEIQTEDDRKGNRKYNKELLINALDNAANKAKESDSILKELFKGFKEGAKLTPKILSLITGVGITVLIIVEYTNIFIWLGMPIIPILNLFGIPDATSIAASTIVGITEMYLPVLLIADSGVSTAASFFIVVLSLVQIVFFAETAVIILATGIPVTAKELVIIFFERTIIAIPIIAVFMHLLF